MIKVEQTELRVLPIQTRLPFRYGVAVLKEVPHLFVQLELGIDGELVRGVAADNLPPKWFTKDKSETFAEELSNMLSVIRHACEVAKDTAPQRTVFAYWLECLNAQRSWAEAAGYPPLLWQFGLSFIERALIDAFCKAKGVSFAAALQANLFGLELGHIYPELAGLPPAAFLLTPLKRVQLRHTLGLGDPLTDAEIPEEERVHDGLPQSLEAALDSYGVRHLKLKLSGDDEHDLARLEAVAELLKARGARYSFTLDGNEQYPSLESFRGFWERLRSRGSLADFLRNLLFVEQPVRRDAALTDALADELRRWDNGPPLIIDESDADVNSLARALAVGYAGTSHKNCKGVFKSVANLGLLEKRRLEQLDQTFVLSAEDLTVIGPVSLQQDLAVVSALGINHVERNGHHYFKGLSMFEPDLQQRTLRAHADLYRDYGNFVGLRVTKGELELSTVVSAPFGVNVELDLIGLEPVEHVAAPFFGAKN